MKGKNIIKAATLSSIIALISLPPALSQEAEKNQTTSEDKEKSEKLALEEIVVTGTRIKRPDLVSNSPVTVIDAEYLKNHGLGRIEDAISTFPQVMPMLGLKGSGETSGVMDVNLRRLGSGRTLTLLNGVRMINDVGEIPSALLQRVDILTGGASAVYGSDAIAGVVNFITKTRYNGVTVDAEMSAQQHDNDNDMMRALLARRGYPTPKKSFFGGEQYNINIVGGTDFEDGRGNISGFFNYKKTSPIKWADLDHAGCSLTMNRDASYGDGYVPPPQLKNDAFDCGYTEYRPYGHIIIGEKEYQLDPNGSKNWVAFNEASAQRVPTEDYIQRGDDVYRAGGFATYDVSDYLKLTANVMYSQTDTSGRARRQFADDVMTQVRCDNSMLSAAQRALVCGSGNPDRVFAADGVTPVSGTVQSIIWRPAADQNMYFKGKSFRVQVGASGDITDSISYSLAYAHYTRRDTYSTDIAYINDFNGRVSDGIAGIGASGNCVVPAGSDNSKCVAANIYSYDSKGLGDALYDFTTFPGATHTRRDNDVAIATLNGDLEQFGIVSPFATQPVRYVFAGEYRRDKVTTGGTGAYDWFVAYTGKQDALEGSAEINIPLIQDVPLIKDLSFDGAYRLSDYSSYDGGTVKTWKAELSWAPSSDVTFRASANHAFRVAEKERLEGIHRYTDNIMFKDLCAPPAAGSIYQRYTFAQCSHTMTQAQYNALTNDKGYGCNSDGFCRVGALINGGRADLKPETSNSYTVGLVMTPSFIPGFSATLDWYSIDIKDAFEWVRDWQIFDYCYDSNVTVYCDQYKRDPTTGRILEVDARWLNAGMAKTKGIDIGMTYFLNLKNGVGGVNIGNFNFGLNGTITQANKRQYTPGAPTISCAGYFGSTCGTPWPKWRHTASTTWLMPWGDASLNLTWRYIAETTNDRLSSDPVLKAKPNAGNTNTFPLASHMPAQSYFDMAFGMPLNENFSIRVNAQNIFDTEPPLLGSPIGNTFNTYPAFYDVLGRTVRVGVTATF